MRILSIILIFLSSVITHAQSAYVVDSDRNRKIPIEIYLPDNSAVCSAHKACPVSIISAGYGIKHTDYSFIAKTYTKLGYLVVAVDHELPGDPPLAVEGDLYNARIENWVRGAKTLEVVIKECRDQFRSFDFEGVTLIGHSNGGDISAWLANKKPNIVRTLVTLDHRRVPLPRNGKLHVISVRTSDFPADEGVIPTAEEQAQLNICVITIPNSRHNDMSDHGPKWLKDEIVEIIRNYSLDSLSCASL